MVKKAIPKRQLPKSVVVYIENSDDAIRRIYACIYNPHIAAYENNIYDSKDIIEEGLSIKEVGKDFLFFILQVNDGMNILPQMIIFDKYQYDLIININEKIKTSIMEDSLILQQAYYNLFKYDSKFQNFSLSEISDNFNIEDYPYRQFFRLVLLMERCLKDSSKRIIKSVQKSKSEEKETTE